MEIIIALYLIVVCGALIYIVYSFLRDKESYMKVACQRILSTIKCMDPELTNLDTEIEQLYECFSRNMPYIKSIYPNVVVWLEDIVYRINSNFKYARPLREYVTQIKSARDRMRAKYPFAECEKYQQEILGDLQKIQDDSNKIIIDNIIARTEGEFIKLNSEAKKNNKTSYISLLVTIISIIVTIVSIF